MCSPVSHHTQDEARAILNAGGWTPGAKQPADPVAFCRALGAYHDDGKALWVSCCTRCGGAGVVKPWGACFRCGGHDSARHERRTASVRTLWRDLSAIVDGKTPPSVVADRKREDKRDAAADARLAAAFAWLRANGCAALVVQVDGRDEFAPHLNGFVRDVARKAGRFELSPKQVAVLLAACAEPNASDAVATRCERIAAAGCGVLVDPTAHDGVSDAFASALDRDDDRSGLRAIALDIVMQSARRAPSSAQVGILQRVAADVASRAESVASGRR